MGNEKRIKEITTKSMVDTLKKADSLKEDAAILMKNNNLTTRKELNNFGFENNLDMALIQAGLRILRKEKRIVKELTHININR